MKWSPSSVEKWCQKYEKLAHSEEIKNWCRTFPEKYKDFSEDDKRRKIFCVPIILYISANTKIDIVEHSSVGEIYDKAFREIAHRKHGIKQESMDAFDEEKEEKQRLINWQFTKEVAYQMFLNDTLYISDTRDSKLLDNAKNRTAKVLKDRGVSINKEDIEIPQYLAMFHFARQGNDGTGIEFAHKTVYEYFTAVKLYEDYFAEITKDYPKPDEGYEMLERVWTNIIEAFRYKSIDEDNIIIFDYLNEMELPVYDGKSEKEEKYFDFKKFESYFVEGMKQKILADLTIKKRVKEYVVNSDLLTTKIGCAFRNLTWFLTERKNGFFNEDDVDECKDFKEFISDKYSDLNLENWNLSGANFENVILSNAILVGTNLRNADLSKSNLEQIHFINVDLTESNLYNVNLSHSNMKRVQLIDANMKLSNLDSCFIYECNIECAELGCSNLHNVTMIKTCLYGTTMQGVNLTYSTVKECDFTETEFKEADLSGTVFINSNLDEADLRRAQYCLDVRYETKFPEGFNPKEHGMIEVDIYGYPVKKSETENNVEE